MRRRKGTWASLFLAVLCLTVTISPVMAGAGREELTVTKGPRISVNVDNKPLSAVLRMMAEKKLFNMAGGGGANEPLTLHFSNLTLSEALAKMMRGYNYVLLYEGKGGIPLLTVMGKIDRATSAPRDKPGAGATPAANIGPEPRSYVPPEPATPPPAAAMPPARPRQPLAPPQTRENRQPAASAAPVSPPGVQAQPAPSTGMSETGLPGAQQAQPVESPGVHF